MSLVPVYSEQEHYVALDDGINECGRCEEPKSIFMPKDLTAENGAKALLIGEFYEEFSQQCGECHGDGVILTDPDGEEGDVEAECGGCFGSGERVVRVPVSWITIKAIYKMAVERLGKDL